MRPAPVTFDTKLDASTWLATQIRDVERGLWQPPQQRKTTSTFGAYAASWLAGRDLTPATRQHYQGLLDQHLLPALSPLPLDRIDPTTVRGWYGTLNASTPTRRAHAYSLLRAIFSTAVSDDLVPANPCRIRGAGSTKSKHRTRVASLGELEVMVEATPSRYRAMLLLAAWCGLRFGELAELRRKDVDLEDGVVRVERGVTRVAGEMVVGDPKSEAGKRTVSIPPHLLPVVEKHLSDHTSSGPDGLLFPARGGGHMVPSSLYKVFYPAREAAGRPDLRFHDLRHTGATLAAATGATLADLMTRLGHSTPAAALRYQHSVADRDKAIAAALSGFAEAKVVPLRRAKG
jgi:integrase